MYFIIETQPSKNHMLRLGKIEIGILSLYIKLITLCNLSQFLI